MSFIVRSCAFGAVLVTIVTSVLAYHFDVDNIILYEDPARSESRGSYFGYTVALWNPGNRHLNESWMFIGAPRANSTLNSGKIEPGTIFKCQIGTPCKEWVIEYGNAPEPTNSAWLGGSMNIENKSNPGILVCAPRQTNSTILSNQIRGVPRAGMRGMCYLATVASNLSDFRNIIRNKVLKRSPFLPSGYRQEIGFATHVSPDFSKPEFILGCPNPMGSYGPPIRFNRSGKGTFIIPSPSADNVKNENDYTGYAVTSGKYFDAQKRMYAVGAPRSASLNGSVTIFDFPTRSNGLMTIFSEETGDYIGEYFGAALASCDINGDKKDDLLVGAPQWTRILDEGRVYIFGGNNSTDPPRFETRSQFEGKTPGGRFGSTITCLGDIDYDGYADVAVGAPYDGNGAVYIFHGSENGLTSNPQKIAGPKATRGFGISISEARDVDNNGYADIAVGAYLSGHVTLIRSKRVVTMAVHMKPNFIGEQLDLKAESFSVSVCSTYGGPYAPQELNVIRELKIDEMYGRAKVEIDGKNLTTYEFSDTLKSDTTQPCRNFTITITKTANFEYLNPLQLDVSQRLNRTEENNALVVGRYNVSGNDNFHTSDAVKNEAELGGAKYSLYIPFKLDCNNNTCRPNLSIEMTTDLEDGTGYVIGSTSPQLRLDVKVNNFGDSAYSAKAYIYIPIYIRILKMPSTCTKDSKTATYIMCEVGNPLAKNELKTFSINLDMSKTRRDVGEIEFTAIANTTSKDAAIGHHRSVLLIDGVVEADIEIMGKTNMDSRSYIKPQKDKRLSNIMFSHIYQIRNYEVTPLSQALVQISFPTHWVHADKEIEIAKLNKTLRDLDGREFDCQIAKEFSNIHSLNYDASTMPEWLFGENSSSIKPELEKKFTIVDGKVFSAFANDRTLHINTTNPSVKWKTINCTIGPFETAQSVASVVLTFDLLLSNLPSEIMQDKDIIFFATNGSTKITKPYNYVQTVDKKPDVVMIGTMIIELAPERQIAPWVIALSILIGLLLLILAVFTLFKFGFFHRSKKAKLEALMKQNGRVVPRVLIETSTSTEALDVT